MSADAISEGLALYNFLSSALQCASFGPCCPSFMSILDWPYHHYLLFLFSTLLIPSDFFPPFTCSIPFSITLLSCLPGNLLSFFGFTHLCPGDLDNFCLRGSVPGNLNSSPLLYGAARGGEEQCAPVPRKAAHCRDVAGRRALEGVRGSKRQCAPALLVLRSKSLSIPVPQFLARKDQANQPINPPP